MNVNEIRSMDYHAEDGERAMARTRIGCAARHFGPWAVLPRWANEFVATLRAVGEERLIVAERESPTMVRSNEIAIVPIHGLMSKGDSKFSEASTVDIRRAVREAAADDAVGAIMLHVDSPGGSVAGVQDLADDVRSAGERKPVHAYVEDLGASAAYWVASQAASISMNRTGEAGSIGVYAVVEDSSGRAEAAGIRVHVVSTGPHKGALVDGVPIAPESLAELQSLVNKINGFFTESVRKSRSMSAKMLEAVTDGRVFVGQDAVGVGLVDQIETFDAAMSRLRRAIGTRRRETRKAALSLADCFR